ncbi:MAG TPA: formate dehydrogenase [Casimicrobiaceae bacterium]|jgi:hypothetical protein|nr:formate dehydrogenase [Casimicrobiaceae bacterium]
MRSSPSKPRRTPENAPQSESRSADAKRRGFLLALGAGGIGAAALAARSLPGTAPAAAADGSAAPAGEGYRETDHVKRYYQTAKT